MDFDEVVKKRKMMREYQQGKQIPTDLLNKLLRNAHSLPSTRYTQVLKFILVIDTNSIRMTLIINLNSQI